MIEDNKTELIETSLIWVLSVLVAGLGFLLVWLVCSVFGGNRFG